MCYRVQLLTDKSGDKDQLGDSCSRVQAGEHSLEKGGRGGKKWRGLGCDLEKALPGLADMMGGGWGGEVAGTESFQGWLLGFWHEHPAGGWGTLNGVTVH